MPLSQVDILPINPMSVIWYGTERISVPRNDNSISCVFRSAMFTTFFNPVFGNCYTFNSGIGKNTDELLWAYKSGRQYGNVLTVEYQLSPIETMSLAWVYDGVSWPSTPMDIPEPSHGRSYREKQSFALFGWGCLELAHRLALEIVMIMKAKCIA